MDAVHRDRTHRKSIASIATALILIQVVFVYVSNAVAKAFSDSWHSGEAATLVLGLDNITFLFGELTRAVPRLLQLGGFIWFLMLSLAWLLFLLRGRLRTAFALMFIGVHASFALTVRIGAFPYVSISGVLLFLQAQFWRDATALAERTGLDTNSLPPGRTRFRRIAQSLPNLRIESDRIYRLFAAVHTAVIALIVVSIVLVVAVLLMNVGYITEDQELMEHRAEKTLQEAPGVNQIERVAVSLNIDQPGWSIFAPEPRTTDRYYVFPAETADGAVLDVYNDRSLTFDRPQDGALQKQFGTYRERFYMNSIRRAGLHGSAPEQLARYLCDSYQDDRDTELVRLSMYVIEEDVTFETIDAPADRDRTSSLLFRHGCGDHESGEIEPPEF